MKSMKLDKKVLEYFEKQHKQNEGPVCVIYIDAHGNEDLTYENDCVKDDATIFSFAGIAGAVNYVKLQEKDGKMIPSSQYFRDMMEIHNTSPRNIKAQVEETALFLKPKLKEHHEELISSRASQNSAKWTKKHLDKALTPMKQIVSKRYTFFESDESKRVFFDFGVYIMNVSSPDMEGLVGENIISCEFAEKNPEVGKYLKKISENKWNEVLFEKFPKELSGNCVRTLTFKELIHILKMIGFKYSYIFDGSCRTNVASNLVLEKDEEVYEKLATKERNVSLKKMPFKMKSADKIKTRRRVLSDKVTMKSNDIPRAKIKNDFHNKIEYDIVTLVDDIKDIIADDENIQELQHDEIYVTMEETEKLMTFSLYANSIRILTCKISIHFLKVTNIKISLENINHLKNSEPILYREILKVKKLFIEGIKKFKKGI
jgi:hypothetical protein